jgi:hypothetical protein
MLGLQQALDHPTGRLSLIVANGLATIPGYLDATTKLLQELDADIAAALVTHGRAGTSEHPD